MEDSQQGNDKRKRKVIKKYNVWTTEESNELLKLMVDAVTRGWCDTNGSLSKITVQEKILPALNEKLGCEKTFSHYQSRLKWFKQRYNYCELMCQNSRFEWDPVTKKFTATDEVWEDYFKSHPTHKNYRADTFAEYEDLKIAIGNRIALGKHSIGMEDDACARTFKVEESRDGGLDDDFIYDHSSMTFIQSDQRKLSYQPSSPRLSSSPLPSQPMNSEVPPTIRKRNRTEYDKKSDSFETNNVQSDAINKLTQVICNISRTIDTFVTREQGCWKFIKEIPNLDNNSRFKVLKLLNTRVKKIEFMEMTLEERSDWINFELME